MIPGLLEPGSTAVLTMEMQRGVVGDLSTMDSLVADLLFLYRFYSHPDAWGHLSEIFASVKRDFKPARGMGYTLALPKA